MSNKFGYFPLHALFLLFCYFKIQVYIYFLVVDTNPPPTNEGFEHDLLNFISLSFVKHFFVFSSSISFICVAKVLLGSFGLFGWVKTISFDLHLIQDENKDFTIGCDVSIDTGNAGI